MVFVIMLLAVRYTLIWIWLSQGKEKEKHQLLPLPLFTYSLNLDFINLALKEHKLRCQHLLDETHLVVMRGLTHQEVSRK